MRLPFLSIIFFSYSFTLCFSQEDAWVYFSDKLNVQNALQNPNTILSQRALNRKAFQNITIDERDVPINENYINTLKQQNGIDVLAKSKWFNAVHVRGSEIDINLLSQFSFVSQIDFANKNINNYSNRTKVRNKFLEIKTDLAESNYGATQNQTEMINLDLLHSANFKGNGVHIAVMDAGFPAVNTMGAFERLRDQNKLLGGFDFVDRLNDVYAFSGNSHGTMVLSTMGAYIENEYEGTAIDASYYLFRTEDVFSETPLEESLWVEAAERADSLGVDIINSSLGYTTFDNSNYNYTNSDMDGSVAFISKGAGIAYEKGILVVNSAGNSGANSWTIIGAPADHKDVFSIGAVDSNGDYAYFSSIGNNQMPFIKPDVVARGLESAIVDVSNTIQNYNGTSFSGPIVAGAVACLKQALPYFSNDDLKLFVHLSSSQYTSPDLLLGYGIPDFSLAYQLSLKKNESEELKFKYDNDFRSLELISDFIQNMEFTIYDISGKLIIKSDFSEHRKFIDCSDFNNGIYLLKYSHSPQSQYFKFVIY